MTKKLLIVLGATVVAGIGIVTAIVDRQPTQEHPGAAAPAAVPSSAADSASPASIPDAGSTDSSIASRVGNVSSPAGTFGEAVVFTIGYVCDDAGTCAYRPAPRHEYATYTRQQLETIADFDGAAAIILANRLGATDRESARRWAVRGFLLTGDPYAFHMATLYSGVQVGARLTADGDLDAKAAEEAYIWLRIGHELGVGDAEAVSQQARILEDYRVFEAERLDAEADARLRHLVEERVRLTGRTF